MLPAVMPTKLFIPEMRENSVFRKPLVDKLVCGISRNSGVTLVSAPAGYGKTTLVLELLDFVGQACAWISLDDGDNDPAQFLAYLIEALKKAGVTIGSNTESVASDFEMSRTTAPISMIINDIASFPKKVILVLDDFHLISSPQVNDIVKFLLEHQPPNIHVIMITREDPHIPLSRIRVQGRITEIRMGDLCFAREEAAEFLTGSMKLRLSSEAVDTIAIRTEGWAAGLQLAGLSLYGCEDGDIGAFIREFGGTQQYVIDYLVEEVINRLPEEVCDFLCKTSILDRMNGELCDAVTGKKNSSLLLRELEKQNLFLIPLDPKRDWYRYHHLFADSLRTELSKEEELHIHKKAALWLEDNGFRQEAVKHAFKSGDMLLSLRLVEGNMEQAFNYAQLATFVKWLEQLPGDLVKGSEILSVRIAWALLLIGRGNETVKYMASLGEDFMEKTTPHNIGLLLSLKALFDLHEGRDNAEIMAEEALRFLEPWDFMARSATLSTLGRAQESLGKTTDAVKTHYLAYNESIKLGHTFITTLALMNLGNGLNNAGRRKEAIGLYSEYIEGMTGEFGKPLPHIGITYVGIGELFYESNELEKAKFYIQKGLELCQGIFFNWVQNSAILEARLLFALGEREAAIESVRKSLNAIPREIISELLVINTSILIELLLRNGNVDEARQYEQRLKSFMGLTGNTAGEKACLPYARLLLYQNRKDEALEILENIKQKMEGTGRIRELITFYILYSKAHYMARDHEKADFYMEKAICLAEPQEYYRLFLDEEAVISDVICGKKKAEGQFIKRIIVYMKVPAESDTNRNGSEHIDRLSKREIEILELLAKGMSNNEISKALFISTNTTQWHISHIYSKLDVRSRTQAILKAKEHLK